MAAVSTGSRVRPRWRRPAERLRALVASGWLVLVVLLAWEVWGRVNVSPFFPPISDIAAMTISEWFVAEPSRLFLSDLFWRDGLTSLARAAEGWALAVIIGVGFGLVLGVWKAAAAFFNPLIRFGMSVPSTALLPLAVVFFGITGQMNVALITFGTVWVILINTIDGVRSIDRTIILTARSVRLRRSTYFAKVLLPGASPQIFAGLRVSIGIGLILMVVSELFAATEGIGFYIMFNQRIFQYTKMWSAILLVAILGIALNTLFSYVENRVLAWNQRTG